MKFTLFSFLTVIVFAMGNTHAENRFWPSSIDRQLAQNTGRAGSQMGNCTRKQEYKYVLDGYSIAEIDRLCGVLSPEQEETQDSSMVVPERIVKKGSVIDVFNDGKVTLTINRIYRTPGPVTKVRQVVITLRRPHRGKNVAELGIGEAIKFEFRRQLFRLTALDIFLDDQVAKISVQHIGAAEPK